MNPIRFALAILATFVVKFATDYLIHGVWLAGAYTATQSLWRTDAEMQAHFGWLLLSQFIFSATFTTLWAKGFAAPARVQCACRYGLFMGLFSEAATLVTYTVQPFPADIALKWFGAGLGQGVLLGLVVFFVYKPNAPDAQASGASA